MKKQPTLQAALIYMTAVENVAYYYLSLHKAHSRAVTLVLLLIVGSWEEKFYSSPCELHSKSSSLVCECWCACQMLNITGCLENANKQISGSHTTSGP